LPDADSGEVYTVAVTDLNNLGCGVGRLPGENGTPGTGLVLFVKGAVTGDVIETAIIKRTSSYAIGRLVRVVTPSPLRAKQAFCQAPEACGGCVFRHLEYEAELDSKHRRVEAAFRQAGLSDVTVLPVLTGSATSGYRNKGMYPVQNGKHGVEAGFYAAKSHTLIPSTACALQPPVFAKLVQTVCDFCNTHCIPAYNERTGQGILRHIYLRSSAGANETEGQIMVCLVVRVPTLPGGERTVQALVDMLRAAAPSVVSIQLNINQENTNVVLGDTFLPLFGQPYMEDTLCGRHFRISAGSFYQVNHDAAELLYRTAARMAGLTGKENLWDLYCGTGTIGLSMVGRIGDGQTDMPGAATVTGVEIVPEAVECARQNADINAALGLIPPGVACFFCADAGDPASMLSPADGTLRGGAENRDITSRVPPPDVVVIDPPRKGTTPALIHELARRSIRSVVYISCDPETLARDCAIFRSCGYAVGQVQPVDLFPRTGHVECVVLMSRNK
jgi:23S rRNA (uracil1939-C5)-methyltransferase